MSRLRRTCWNLRMNSSPRHEQHGYFPRHDGVQMNEGKDSKGVGALPTFSITCFSKALGTSLLSSDKLLLIRSRRRFSMICRKQQNKGGHFHYGCKLQSEGRWSFPLIKKKKKKGTVKRLTPLRLFLAKICEDVVGDMEPRVELKFLDDWEKQNRNRR